MEAAFASFPEAEFEVRWTPYQLKSGLLTISKLDGYMSFIKDEEKVRSYWSRLRSEGSQTGINFEFDGQMSDTFDAHRLAEWALESKGPQAQDKLVEAQFSEYMERGAPPSDRASLLRAVEKAGLDVAEAERVLHSGEFKMQTEARIRAVRPEVRGVPHFYVNGESKASGAMSTDEWVSVLRPVAAAQEHTVRCGRV